jgi:protein required for attachment to host cells
MKPTVTWILVADGARARILRNDGPGKGLHPALPQDFAASHAATRDLGTERPGRGHGPAPGTRHGMQPHADWHEFQKHEFARAMADILNRAAERKEYDRLILVAPPKTLGDLRAELDRHAAALVTGTLDKDLTHLTIGELPDHLGALLPV